MNTATHSNAIVSSLFPAEICDHLFKGDGVDAGAADMDAKAPQGHQFLPNIPEAEKFRLKIYLNEEELPNQKKGTTKRRSSADKESKLIADLFPHTTVMFADIAGFMAWSLVWEPLQVLTLLETVYTAFDTNAKKR